MKKSLVILFLLLLSAGIFAESFYIDSYDINIKVEESGLYHIRETLDIIFTSPSHGLYRDIQYLFDNPINSWDIIRANISNIECNMPYEIEQSDRFLSLKIGDSSKVVEGKERIEISYDFDLGGDLYPDEYDEFYYNLISAAWDCPIMDISYKVEFPKALDKDRIWVTYGDYGSDKLSQFTLEDQRIVKGLLDNLNPHQALTLRVEMENGYFSRQAKDIRGLMMITLALSALLAILFSIYSFISYKRYGIDNALTPPIVFYPPDEFDPLDVGYVYDENKDKERGITAMFFYFADKGYLKIEESDKKKLIFTKLKELQNDEGKAEKLLFSLLFGKHNSVTFKDLERDGFYNNIDKVYSLVKAQFKGEQSLYDIKARKRRNLNSYLFLLISAIIGIIISLPSIGTMTIAMVGVNIIPSLLLLALASNLTRKHHTRSKAGNILAAIPIAIVTFISLSAMASFNAMALDSTISIVQPIAVLASYLVSIFSIVSTDKRSVFGEKVLEECLGYKDFIERVEIDRLKVLIDDNPELFYSTLSYAIVFGLEDTWARKFKTLYIPRCTWYSPLGGDIVDAMFYSSLIRRTRREYNAMQTARSVGPTSGGGGSRTFSGSSGFSGGGFSGGGGRSW